MFLFAKNTTTFVSVLLSLREMYKESGKANERRTPRFNNTTEAAIQETRDIIDGKKSVKTYDSAEEMFEDLDNSNDDQDK